MVHLLNHFLFDLVYLKLSQSRSHSHLLKPPMWEHILQLLLARELLVPPLLLLMQFTVQGLVLNRETLFFLHFLVNPNLKVMHVALILPTVISCIINVDFFSLSGIQVRRWNPTNVVSGDLWFHAVSLQEVIDHILHLSGEFLVSNGNTDLAILPKKDNLTFQCSRTR